MCSGIMVASGRQVYEQVPLYLPLYEILEDESGFLILETGPRRLVGPQDARIFSDAPCKV